jgi:hypothetical protein
MHTHQEQIAVTLDDHVLLEREERRHADAILRTLTSHNAQHNARTRLVNVAFASLALQILLGTCAPRVINNTNAQITLDAHTWWQLHDPEHAVRHGQQRAHPDVENERRRLVQVVEVAKNERARWLVFELQTDRLQRVRCDCAFVLKSITPNVISPNDDNDDDNNNNNAHTKRVTHPICAIDRARDRTPRCSQ